MEGEHAHTTSVARYAGLSRVEAWIAYGHGDLPTSRIYTNGSGKGDRHPDTTLRKEKRRGGDAKGGNRLYTTSCFPRGMDSFWFLIRARGSDFDLVVRGTGFSHWVFSTGTICILFRAWHL